MRTELTIRALASIGVLLVTAAIAVVYVYDNTRFPFSFGLDLAGGTQVTYDADVSGVPEADIDGRMSALQDLIERRVNALGVSEPKVYTSVSSVLTGLPVSHRLVVELPGVTDIEEATRAIGKTPYLEFKIYNAETESFDPTELQGGHVISAGVQFMQGISGSLTNEPVVLLRFSGEGGSLFGDLTRANVGNMLGIFLDGTLISSPVIRSVILGGTTQIEGNFTLETAGELADSLSLGALPIPIELAETRTVNPSLGGETVDRSVTAAFIAFALVALLFLMVYRFVGLVAVIALVVYVAVIMAVFKVIPVVLTAAGLAGFIISLGFAVDANVLIFERMREELRDGAARGKAIEDGFRRAWCAIRDANITSIIIAFLLFWFGTSIIKGFALAFIIGVLLSMLSAYLLTRLFLRTTVKFGERGALKKWYIV